MAGECKRRFLKNCFPTETCERIFVKKKGMTSNDPLHGKTLEAILTELVHHFGWEHLAEIVRINCFISNPSINSSLKFLRKTAWARKKVEDLYIKTMA